MSQHIDPTPKQTDLNSLNSNIANLEGYALAHKVDSNSLTISANSENSFNLSSLNNAEVKAFYVSMSGAGYTQCIAYLEQGGTKMWIRNNSNSQVTISFIAHRIYSVN